MTNDHGHRLLNEIANMKPLQKSSRMLAVALSLGATIDASAGTCPNSPGDVNGAWNYTGSGQITPGVPSPVTLTVQNIGSSTWYADGNGARPGFPYRLAAYPSNQISWQGGACGGYSNSPTDQRVYLCSDVPPGGTAQFKFNIVAPAGSSGTLRMAWTLLEEAGSNCDGFFPNGAYTTFTVVGSTDPGPLGTPGNLQVIGGRNRIDLSWDAAANTERYSVFHLKNGDAAFTFIGDTNATTFADTGLPDATTYHYVVRSVRGTEFKEARGSATTLPAAPPPPPPPDGGGDGGGGGDNPTPVPVPDRPTDLQGSRGAGQVNLSWRPVAAPPGEVIQYHVKRTTAAEIAFGQWREVVTTSQTSWTDNDVLNEQTYIYVVNAQDSGGVSPDSASVTVTPRFVGRLCPAPGYVVGFFNGVRNTPADALRSIAKLRRSTVGWSYNNQPVDYEMFYNVTGPLVNATALQDFVEVFQQRAGEAGIGFGDRLEIFWEILNASKSQDDFLTTLMSKLQVNPIVNPALSQIYSDFAQKEAVIVRQLTASPPTAIDYGRQHARALALNNQGKKLLFVAHSQGNLFVNQAYDTMMKASDLLSVNVVHVAPASASLRGQYTLSDTDAVIGALNKTLPAPLVPPNVNIGLPHVVMVDPTGHSFTDTYLFEGLPALPMVQNHVQAAMSALVEPRVHGAPGLFNITMSWSGSGKGFMKVVGPNGEVYRSDDPSGETRNGVFDAASSNSPGANDFAAWCNATTTGTYKIAVGSQIPILLQYVTVQVSTPAGVIWTKTLQIPPVSAGQTISWLDFGEVDVETGAGGVPIIRARSCDGTTPTCVK